jgi:hypothetical protein
MRPKASVLTLVGVMPSWLKEGGMECVICNVMEAWKKGPYRLPWQELLSSELLAVQAACTCTVLVQRTGITLITHGRLEGAGPLLNPCRLSGYV